MRYYSDKLDKIFDTLQDCEKAEKEYDDKIAQKALEKAQKQKEKALRYAEIKEAQKVLKEAQTNYYTLVQKYIEDFGSIKIEDSASARDFNQLFPFFFRV